MHTAPIRVICTGPIRCLHVTNLTAPHTHARLLAVTKVSPEGSVLIGPAIASPSPAQGGREEHEAKIEREIREGLSLLLPPLPLSYYPLGHPPQPAASCRSVLLLLLLPTPIPLVSLLLTL
ncbi:hypothetical protein BHE74_00002779 [Ensete ventricosum]|nr:hypothetical protein GW17_00018686 [Ensete ventricosum]RWW88347.1 hypothetical protein BHE74_00002779 [Ensete ventricosum]RZS27542.1 hypothetical protein BHM03_00061033 [Ensete ventricosum]